MLTYIILENASRAGFISNMTMEEFYKSVAQQDGLYILTVKNHKTAARSEPAMLSLTDILIRHLQQFVEKIKNRLPGIRSTGTTPVFIIIITLFEFGKIISL